MTPIEMKAVERALKEMLARNHVAATLSPEMERAARYRLQKVQKNIERHERKKAEWKAREQGVRS